MTRRLAMLMAVLSVVAIGIAATAPLGAVAQEPLQASLTGPNAIAPGGTGRLFLNASGGPGERAGPNITVRYWITGADLTGGSPVSSAPVAAVPVNGTYELNVTAPQKEQVITVVVQVNSSAGATFETTTLTHAITVVTPVVLTATFENRGGAAAVSVPVKFYVDGKLVGTTNITRIEPSATGVATLSYLPVGLGPGSHSVRVEADLNGNNVIEADRGEVVLLDTFQKKEFELSWGWALVIMSIMVSVTFVVVRGVRRGRR